MKSRNLAKIVTLILSCALLIGAVVGISSIAEETEESNINIVGANVAYEGAVQVVYYVEVKDTTKTPYLLVSYEEIVIGENAKINELGSKVSVKKQAGTLTANGVDYPAFYSNGIAPKELRKDIYAVPVLADENGNIVEVGEAGPAAVYSPYTYAMRRFGQSATPAQTELYKALLNYGAAVQAVLDPETAGTEANPWADEYWDVTIDGTKYTRGNLFNGTYTANRFIEDGAKSFTGWTDAEDKPVLGWTNMTFKPGVSTVLKSNYAKTPEGLATFDDGTLGNATTNATAMDKKVTDGDNKSSDAFYEIKDGYFVFEQYNDLENGDNIKYPLTPAYATTYVYEADFNITEWDMSANAWLHKFAFWNSNGDEICNITLDGSGKDAFTFGGKTFALNEWHHIKLVMTVAADGTLSASATLDGAATGGAGFQSVGVSKDYRVANAGMALRNGGKCNTYNSTTLFDNVVAYTDGSAASYELVLDANGGEDVAPYTVTMGEAYKLPTPVNGDLPFAGWYIGDTLVEQTGTWNYIGSHTVEVDGKNVTIYGTAPTLVAKWAAPVNVTLDANGGTVSSDTATVYAGKAYTLPTPERAGLIFGGWCDADGNMYAAKGTSWAGETDVALTAKWYVEVAGVFNDFNDGTAVGVGKIGSVVDGAWYMENTKGWNPSTYFPVKADKSAVTGNLDGAKYVFEADFTYVGGAPLAAADNPAFMGFSVKGFGANDNMISSGDHVKTNGVASPDGDASAVIMYGQTHEKGVTYKIRYEYIIGEGQYINVYVNGEYKTQYKLANNKNVANVSEVYGFDFVWRRVGNFKFDNVYCGVIAPAVDTTFTLDANGGTLSAEDEGKIFSIGTGDNYTLPTPTRDGFAFAGWYYGATKIATSGNWSADFGGETPALVAKWMIEQAHSTDFEDGTIPSWITGGGLTVVDGALQAVYNSKGIHFKPVETVAGASVGTKYVFEMDFTFHGIDTASDNNLAFIGFSHTDATWEGGTHKWAYLGANNVGDTVYFYGNAAKKDQTINIRFEFTVTGASTGDLEVYVNGMTGSNTTGGVIKDLNTGDFHQFNIQWRGAADNRNLSATIDNVTVAVEYPVVESTVTLDPNGGVLPEGAITGATVLPGATVALPTPTNGEYKFDGWYNGDTLVDNNYVVTATATLTAKWLDVTTTEFNDTDIAASANKSHLFTRDGYAEDEVAVSGTKYTFTTDFIYKGLTSFSGAGTAEKPIVAQKKNAVYAYMGFMTVQSRSLYWQATASGDFVTLDEETGTYVKCADENGVFLEGFEGTDLTKVYFSKFTWAGLTFEIGKTYTVEFTTTIGTVTVTNGVVSATAPLNVKPTATDAEGNVQTGISANLDSKQPYYQIKGFQFETRGGSSVGTTDADSNTNVTYTLNCTFANSTVVEEVPVTNAAEIKATWISARTPIPGTTKYNTKYFGLVKGAEYTIDAPVAVDGYTVTWYLADSKYNATASELPTTGTWNGTAASTYAVAVYTEIPAEETPAEGEATE